MVQQIRPNLSRVRRSGFTLIEIMIVVAIIAILMAILLPVLTGGRDKARKVMEASQIQSIAAASESYSGAYRSYPGYYTEATVWANHEEFTNAENLVISLLGGGTSVDDVANPFANPERVGFGPSVLDLSGNERIVDAFYNPKDNELGLAEGARWNDNDIPELLGLWSGQPILYFRAQGGAQVPVSSNPVDPAENNDGDEEYRGAFARRINANFTEAEALRTPLHETPRDQANNSLISDLFYENVLGVAAEDLVNKDRYANRTFAAFTAHQGRTLVRWNNANGEFANSYGSNRGALKGGFALVTSGPDGIYFNQEQAGEEGVDRNAEYMLYLNPIDNSTGTPINWGRLEMFDDIVLVTGRTPD